MKNIILTLVIISGYSILKPDPKDPAPAPQAQQAKPGAPSIEAKQLASEQESNLVAEITFDKNKHNVSDKARTALRNLSEKAKSRGKIEKIEVVTFPDEIKGLKDLPEEQQKLVDQRNEALKKQLRDISGVTNVETYSMAEAPSEFDKILSTEEAEIKKSLKETGAMKMPGKASKSIVIYIMEE